MFQIFIVQYNKLQIYHYRVNIGERDNIKQKTKQSKNNLSYDLIMSQNMLFSSSCRNDEKWFLLLHAMKMEIFENENLETEDFL